jgi:CRISPR/Cas system-associated exonuclease Cas4 (RecB family)
VVFSASSVNAYQTCHLQWYFEYVMADPGIISDPQNVGLEVHDRAEKILRRLKQGPPASLNYVEFVSTGDHHVVETVDVFLRDILPTYRDPVLIEAPFQIEVNGIPFSGVIDAVDRQDVPGFSDEDGKIWPDFINILRDLKTTGKRPRIGKYQFAMTGYFLGARDLGYEIDAIQLDYIVRTQHPYYWPEVVSVPDDDDIARWASELQDVAEGVQRADYEPTGLGTYVCRYCPYRDICGPLLRYNAALDK